MSNIFETLRHDHDVHRRILTSLEATSGDTEQRRNEFEHLCADLKAHAAAEERVLYSPLLGDALTREKSSHSIHEHQEINTALAALKETEYSSPNWLPRLKELKHQVEHHEKEEEHEIFQLAGKVLSDDQKRELAIEFEQLKIQELAG